MKAISSQNTSTSIAESGSLGNNTPFDYSRYLNAAAIEYKGTGSYLQVGDIPKHGWVLYVTIVKYDMPTLMALALPELLQSQCTFLIPKNQAAHGMILDGNLGFHEIGKILKIYPPDTSTAERLAAHLVKETTSLRGPVIPSGRFISSCIYADYEYQNSEGITKNLPIWPFTFLSSGKPLSNSKWLKNTYYKAATLKKDAKGNVFKGLNFNKWLDIQWCVIKEGKKFQCQDETGRDIGDRLKWQFKVQSELSASIPVPKVLDLFEKDGDTYLVMEFINGDSFNDAISAIQKGVVWHALEVNEKQLQINLLLQVVDIIELLHQRGYIHRDLNPVNFILTPENKLIAIDVELCYNYFNSDPCPPFTLGTKGYMSPAQMNCQTPDISDDVFGLGGLLIRTFTGFSPTKFSQNSNDLFFNQLNYFIHNKRISSLIASCREDNPLARPTLESIRHNLALYQSQILTTNHIENQLTETLSESNIANTLQKAINALYSFPLLSNDQKWYFKSKTDEGLLANEFRSYTIYPDLHSGTAGILYTLTLADWAGYDLGKGRDVFYNNFNQLKSVYEENKAIAPGLYNGAAGFCLLMSTMIRNGLLEKSIHQYNLISELLSLPNHSLNLYEGLAGQGLALMKCADLLDFPNLLEKVPDIVAVILKAQQRDGSWLINNPDEQGKGVKLTSLLNGISGIGYFLLEYSKIFNNDSAKNAVSKTLTWVLNQRKLFSGVYNWPVNANSSGLEPWFENGFTGISFLFIKAFEAFNDPKYKEAAYTSLMNHPKEITSNYLSQSFGLAGLGEVYLEAYRVFGNTEWYDRAANIAEFLFHTHRQSADGLIYWLDGSDDTPVPDFMSGHSGIVHFLLRYRNKEKIQFPILSI